MSDDYLWDRSGPPDPEVERLEGLLGRFGHDAARSATPRAGAPAGAPAEARGSELGVHERPVPSVSFPVRDDDDARARRTRTLSRVLLAAAAVALAGVLAVRWLAPRDGWEIVPSDGTPLVGAARLSSAGRLPVGEWVETDASSSALLRIGSIGEARLEPNTRARLLRAETTDQRLSLQRGTLHARIWAPPRIFTVETPWATAVDLGCVYTLSVDETGGSVLKVTSGWVAFEYAAREAFVPAGASCATRRDTGPGTPRFDDATPGFRAALETLDFLPGDPGREDALSTVLAEARREDALTLWHLLSRVEPHEREAVYDRLARLVPPPPGVTRAAALAGDRKALDLWWDELGFGSAGWWRLWKSSIG